jgi:hypothetical protein
MRSFVERYPVNKLTLLNKHRRGFYMAVAAAIVARPEAGDFDLLLNAGRNDLPSGHAQDRVVEAMFALSASGNLKPDDKVRLLQWAKGFENPEKWTSDRLVEFELPGSTSIH